MLLVKSHVITFEDRIRKVFNNDYAAALKAANWDTFVCLLNSTGRSERLEWLLTTAGIQRLPKHSMVFESLVTQALEIENEDFGVALQVPTNKFKDDEAKFATDWAAQNGAACALHPQKLSLELLRAGEVGKGYDGVSFFSTAHPVNPFDPAAGTYSNLLTHNDGAPETKFALLDASGVPQPANFARAVSALEDFVMPNGESRALVAKYLLHAPKNKFAARTVTGAKVMSATENVLTDYNIVPVSVPGLRSEPNSYYIVAEVPGELGKPIVYQTREDFSMSTYDGATTRELQVTNMLEWMVRGRKAAAYGHPYLVIKVKVA